MPTKEQETICAMFDRIAPTYDMANRILSFRQDIRWRKKVSDMLPKTSDLSVLDVATGTADLLITMGMHHQNIQKAYGIDLSSSMLSIGREKITALGLSHRLFLEKANASSLPFSTACFDVVTIAFGIRNVTEIDNAIGEFARVLKEDGSLLILEFSLPQHKLLQKFYLFYFRYLLPVIGGLLSKDRKAYRYLNRSVEAFFDREAFVQILQKNGFKKVSLTALSFGIATIYCARKI